MDGIKIEGDTPLPGCASVSNSTGTQKPKSKTEKAVNVTADVTICGPIGGVTTTNVAACSPEPDSTNVERAYGFEHLGKHRVVKLAYSFLTAAPHKCQSLTVLPLDPENSMLYHSVLVYQLCVSTNVRTGMIFPISVDDSVLIFYSTTREFMSLRALSKMNMILDVNCISFECAIEISYFEMRCGVVDYLKEPFLMTNCQPEYGKDVQMSVDLLTTGPFSVLNLNMVCYQDMTLHPLEAVITCTPIDFDPVANTDFIDRCILNVAHLSCYNDWSLRCAKQVESLVPVIQVALRNTVSAYNYIPKETSEIESLTR